MGFHFPIMLTTQQVADQFFNDLGAYMYLRCGMSQSLTSNKRLDFGADADHDTDPGINGMLPLKDRGCSALAYISGLQLYHGLMV